MNEIGISSKLIQSCIEQDRRAQNELYRLTYSRLMNICYRYASNNEEARELFTQGFLKILSNLEKYSLQMPFESWISRVMINSIIDNHRKHIHFKEHHVFPDNDNLERGNGATVNDYENQVNRDEALNLLKQLPPATREVFTLFAIDEYTHREIGTALGISENTSKWHVAEARKKLIVLLKKTFKTEIIQNERHA